MLLRYLASEISVSSKISSALTPASVALTEPSVGYSFLRVWLMQQPRPARFVVLRSINRVPRREVNQFQGAEVLDGGVNWFIGVLVTVVFVADITVASMVL
ncbi:unnamed protein product [Cochlearia groenlandica]